MADETTTAAATPEVVKSIKDIINESVGEIIGASNGKVRSHLVDTIAGREITRRQEAVVKAYDLLQEKEKDLKKIKPDSVTYDVDRKPLTTGYSSAKLDERQKIVDAIEKIKKALEKAFAEKPDYQQLFSLNG